MRAVCDNARVRASLCLRITRSAAFSAVCVFLASGAHWFAGGSGPTLQAFLAGGLVVMAGATVLAGRERPPAVVVGLLLAAQAFLHTLFDVTAPPPELPVPSAVHAFPHGPGEAAHAAGVYGYGNSLTKSAGMLFAHLAAALVTGWWLSQGEAAVWSILRRIGAEAIRWLGPPRVVSGTGAIGVAGPVIPDSDAVGPRSTGALRHSVVRRGPPAVLLA